MTNIEEIIHEILNLEYIYLRGLGQEMHDDILSYVRLILQNHNYKVQEEYEIFTNRRGFIDIVASKDNFNIGIEFDAHKKIKRKSIEKLTILKPDVSIFIVGTGSLHEQKRTEISNLQNVYILSFAS